MRVKVIKLAVLVSVIALLFSANVYAQADDYEFMKAVEAYNEGLYNLAIERLKLYVQNWPEPSAYYLIGYSLYKLGRYEEADKYFDYAFLVDPEYTPTTELEKQLGGPLPEVRPGAGGEIPAPPAREQSSATPALPGGAMMQEPLYIPVQPEPEAMEPAAPPPPVTATTPPPPPVTATTPPPPPVTATAPPPPPVTPPVAPAYYPPSQVQSPELPPFVQGIGTIIKRYGPAVSISIAVIGLLFYLFFAYCLFRIAKKTRVSAAWTAWVPIVQIWTIVAAAGKSGWWVLLLLVPILNVFISIYLWMLITENVGKNRWLGLLMLVPVVSFFYPAYLAFSRSRGGVSRRLGDITHGSDVFESSGEVDLSGEPPVPDLDFDLDEPDKKG